MRPDHSTTLCPRCGYDQRGVVATWTDAWPLTGTCAECGLEFDWGPVLAPERFEPSWCVEYARGVRSFIANCWRTLRSSFWPWRFWSRIQMSHKIRWGRLAGYVAVTLLPLLLIYVIHQAVLATMVLNHVRQQCLSTIQSKGTYVAAFERRLAVESDPVQQAMVRNQLAIIKSISSATEYVDMTYLKAMAEAVLRPLSNQSSGTVASAFGAYPYPAPIELRETLFPNGMLAPGRTDPYPIIIEWVALGQIIGVLTLIGLPISFVLLPISRKRAKVRWSHIVRVAAYSVFIPILILLTLVVLLLVAFLGPPYEQHCYRLATFIGNGGPFLLLVIWWAVAIKRYLKIPHGWAVAPLLAIASVGVLALGLGLAMAGLEELGVF